MSVAQNCVSFLCPFLFWCCEVGGGGGGDWLGENWKKVKRKINKKFLVNIFHQKMIKFIIFEVNFKFEPFCLVQPSQYNMNELNFWMFSVCKGVMDINQLTFCKHIAHRRCKHNTAHMDVCLHSLGIWYVCYTRKFMQFLVNLLVKFRLLLLCAKWQNKLNFDAFDSAFL